MGEVKKFFIQVFFIVLVIVLALLYQFNPGFADFFNNGFSRPSDQVQKKPTNWLQVGTTSVKVEIAETADKRTKGLGGRESLASDSGMLFIFPKADNYKFWMKGLSFPLDFVWIRDGMVVDLTLDVPQPAKDQPDSALPIIESTQLVDQVLEVNAGFVSKNNIRVGDGVKLIKE